jgi:hypothetical protein
MGWAWRLGSMWLSWQELLSLADSVQAKDNTYAAIVAWQLAFGQQNSGILNAIGVRPHLVYDGVPILTFKEQHDRKKQTAA